MSSPPAREGFLGEATLCPSIDQPEAFRRIADGDVVSDREVGDER
jgi:hypothetical protein